MWIKVENNVVVCITTIEMNVGGWIEVESVPAYEDIEGKYQELHYTPENGFWVEYIDDVPAPQQEDDNSVEKAVQSKLAEIDSYDSSSAVNGFIYNGNEFWLDKATRVGLVNSTNMLKQIGEETTTLWLDSFCVTLPCDVALQMLCAIEVYALKCYNKTAEHKSNVKNLLTLEEVENYDYTIGYPEKLMFNAE